MLPFRTLIVEDDTLIAWTIETALVRHGHTVVGIAATEQEALRLAEGERPDMAVVDVRLGAGGDGLVVAEQLQRRHGTAVLLATAQCPQFRGDPRPLDRLVPIACLSKPYNPGMIPAALEYVWRLARDRTDNSVPPGVELFDADTNSVASLRRARRS